jgi:hypothetical protein
MTAAAKTVQANYSRDCDAPGAGDFGSVPAVKSIYLTILGPSGGAGTEGPPYLPRALALFDSIARHNQSAEFAFFCIDGRAADILEALSLPRARIFREAGFAIDGLLALKPTRSIAEYCWTAKSYALGHLLDRHPELDWVVYVDADMLAFGDPDIALPDSGQADFVLTPHRFAKEFASYAPLAGLYNAGYVAFRNSPVGRAALAHWTALCAQSCSANANGETYADQKYLERLLPAFPSGAASHHPGLNAGPWNISQYRLRSSAGRVLLNENPLLLYHFQSLRVFNGRWLDLYFGGRRLPRRVRDEIYVPYLDALAQSYQRLQSVVAVKGLGMAPLPMHPWHWMAYVKSVLLRRTNPCRYPLVKGG